MDQEKMGAPIARPRGGWDPAALAAVAPEIADCLYLVEGGAETVFLLRETRGPEAQPSRAGAWDPWDGVEAVLRIGSFSGALDVRLRREIVRGAPVCFYEPASRLAHWGMLEEFLKKAFPQTPQCDAGNIGQFFNEAPRLAAAAQAKLAARAEAKALRVETPEAVSAIPSKRSL